MISTKSRLAQTLRATPDGLPAKKIAGLLDMTDGQVRTALHRMQEAYIDRWQDSEERLGPRLVAIYCYTDEPMEDCPRPTRKPRGRILKRAPREARAS